MSAANDYRRVRVTCHDRTDRPPKTYDAGLSLRAAQDTGFRCVGCGELVTLAGNAIHEVRTLSRRDVAADA